jgi:polynucleotide 5'-kinase involved in rRNA processing
MTERLIKIRFSFDGADDIDELHSSHTYQKYVVDWRKLYFGLIQSRWRWRRGLRHDGDRYDHFFKVMILGDKKVGKSTLL